MMAYWKDHEKRVAKATGGKRTSRPYANLPDTSSDWLVTECKARNKLPQWIVKAVENARRFTNSQQLGVAVLHEKYKKQTDDLVVMTWGDFLEWFGGEVPSEELSE
jgi:hypothetical protein